MARTDSFAIALGILLSLLLEFLIAPYIAISGIVPNFLVAFVVALAVLRGVSFGPVTPFILGLVFDFVGGGPVGAMAFSLTLFSFVTSRLFARMTNDTSFMAVAFVLLGVLLVDLSYGCCLLALGYQASLLEALAYRVAPCFAYDAIIGVIAYLILARFSSGGAAQRGDIIQIG